jgi:hypothetical protein
MIDALVNAFIEPALYNRLAELYRKQEQGDRNIYLPEPWKGFSEDVNRRCENTLVFHVYRDRTLKQTKLKKQRNFSKDSGIKLQLHKETALGNVRSWKYNENGNISWDKKDSGEFNRVFTTRKALGDTEEKGKPVFKKLETYAKDRPEELKKGGQMRIMPVYFLWTKNGKRIRISELKKEHLDTLRNNEINSWFLDEVKQLGLDTIQRNGFFIPVKKMRIIKNTTKPLMVRMHPKAFNNNSQPEKSPIYYENTGNFGLLIYKNHSGKKENRTFTIVSNLSAKSLGNKVVIETTLEKNSLTFDLDRGNKGPRVLQIGKRVLLYEQNENEIWDNLSNENISKRLYKIKGLSYARIKSGSKIFDYGYTDLLIHNSTGKIKKENGIIGDVIQEKGLFFNNDPVIYNRCLSHIQLNALIENIDFRITYDGNIVML